MLINVNKNQNKKVEELLDEGIASLENENRMAYHSKVNNIYNYQNSHYNTNYLNNNNVYNMRQLDNFNKNFNNVNERKKHNFIYYNGLNTDLIDNTIEALNTGLCNADNNKNYKQDLIQKKKQNIYKKIKIQNSKENNINNNLQKDENLNINNVSNENDNINNTNNNDNNPIKIENYEDENIYKEQIQNCNLINNSDNIEYNINNSNSNLTEKEIYSNNYKRKR